MSNSLAIIVQHTVANYDAWKIGFDAHLSQRLDAGFLGHHVCRNADDANAITVVMPFADRSKVEAFLTSPDLKQKMGEAGVLAPPTVTFCEATQDRMISDRPLPAILVRHRVADYEAWKREYDGFEEVRARYGILGDSVSRGDGDGKDVIVYHQAASRAELEAFVESEELRSGMMAAGVLGPPEIEFLDSGLDTAQYG